jgi:hypothetical protein
MAFLLGWRRHGWAYECADGRRSTATARGSELGRWPKRNLGGCAPVSPRATARRIRFGSAIPISSGMVLRRRRARLSARPPCARRRDALVASRRDALELSRRAAIPAFGRVSRDWLRMPQSFATRTVLPEGCAVFCNWGRHGSVSGSATRHPGRRGKEGRPCLPRWDAGGSDVPSG